MVESLLQGLQLGHLHVCDYTEINVIYQNFSMQNCGVYICGGLFRGDWCKETTHPVSFSTSCLPGFQACHTASWSWLHQSMLLKCQILPSLHHCHRHFPHFARILWFLFSQESPITKHIQVYGQHLKYAPLTSSKNLVSANKANVSPH